VLSERFARGISEALDVDELRRRARRIGRVLTDVDGVLTDAGVYYSSAGEELKRFSVRDGMGVELLGQADIPTVFVTRENSPIVERRAEKLRVRAYLGVRDKRELLLAELQELGGALEGLAYIGDDVNDLPVLELLAEHGITGAPVDAVPEVRRLAHFTAPVPGGRGAFREFADFLLELRRKEKT
jgi:3-deoxy-D-manno-octulosonate 8-phosphate phosphatase (KDO 8-P phosphatase)